MRGVAPFLLLAVRILGACLAVMMILLIPVVTFRFGWPPEAELFISRWPMVLYLFGWFLIPYYSVRPTVIWMVLFLPLIVASSILVKSGVSIYEHYQALPTSDQSLTLFLITLSIITCAMQPIAVGVSRAFRSKKTQAEQDVA